MPNYARYCKMVEKDTDDMSQWHFLYHNGASQSIIIITEHWLPSMGCSYWPSKPVAIS